MLVPKSDKWIRVQWNSGKKGVVNVRYLLKSLPNGQELKIGSVVTVGRQDNGTALKATVLASARERAQLDDPAPEKPQEAVPGPSGLNDQEPEDFSASGSDWEPAGESSSEDSEEEVRQASKKIKIERPPRQYPNKKGRKVITPSRRAKAIIPKKMQHVAAQNAMKKRTRDVKYNENSNSPTELLADISTMFQKLFNIFYFINPDFNINDIMNQNNGDASNTQGIKNEKNGAQDEMMECEYSDRSTDNVLITNRYDNVDNNDEEEEEEESEWVSIGCGTLIHRDKYRNVNWKSYTVATRTLLLAAFSRRTLATHSLTGKKSPAFSDKPAKMCLDPKIVSDIVIEITEKFHVKENLVRSIITTKCADECKMYRMQKNKLNPPEKPNTTDQENIPPPNNGSN